MNFDDLSGLTFGFLRVIKRTENYIRPNGKSETQYTCKCEACGKTVVVRRKNLVTGHTKTCGCKGKEIAESSTDPCISGRCIYFPNGLNCGNHHKCKTCGWNPDNTKLRKERINKLLRKDGIDE